MHVRIGYPSNLCTSHILSFVVFVELLLVEVEIVIGRLRVRGGFARCALNRNLLLGYGYKE